MKEDLFHNFQNVRHSSELLCSYLKPEDYGIQGMEDVSPPKWHLAHTTWFFETFILKNYLSDYNEFHPSFHYLFNSYYQGVGRPFPRAMRGLISRPLIQEIYDYRDYVNVHVLKLLNDCTYQKNYELQSVITLGLEHEQQHQELLLMDIKYNFSLHPDFPTYYNPKNQILGIDGTLGFIDAPGGLTQIGYSGKDFSFDNEKPNHQIILNPFAIASRLVTNKEYLEFILDGGYSTPVLWLSDGWDWVLRNKITNPLYWYSFDGQWQEFTLTGLKSINLMEPVSHVSFFEADAFARWKGCRLPTEAEWEYFVEYSDLDPSKGNFIEDMIFHPRPAMPNKTQLADQFFGDLWEWTSSTYSPYPGYKPLQGSLGEYNGKFMNNQRVLRGGSCVTPSKHIRKSVTIHHVRRKAIFGAGWLISMQKNAHIPVYAALFLHRDQPTCTQI